MFYVETVTIGNRPSFISRFLKGFWKFCEIAGYSRAAAHLASMGLQEEAKQCMMEIKKLKKID